MAVPEWFFGANAGLELLATLASFFIVYFGYRAYKLIHEKRFFYFSLAFFFIGISFLARTIVHLLFYAFGTQPLLVAILKNLNYGSLFYIVLTLVAYLIILAVISGMFSRYSIPLLFLLSLVGIIFSLDSLLTFHIMALLILIFILWRQMDAYFKHRNTTGLFVFATFLLIAVGHVLFIALSYVELAYTFYILAHLFQLGGYLALLFATIRVWIR